MSTRIAECTCSQKFQDATYGLGKRVMNKKAGNDKRVYTCTVCSREHSFGSGEETKKK